MSIDFNTRGEHEAVVHKAKLPAAPVPPTAIPMRRYTLAAMIVAGSDLPKIASRAHIGQLSKMHVSVSIGENTFVSQRQENMKGQAVWNQMIRTDDLTMSARPMEVPDVFIKLCVGMVS